MPPYNPYDPSTWTDGSGVYRMSAGSSFPHVSSDSGNKTLNGYASMSDTAPIPPLSGGVSTTPTTPIPATGTPKLDPLSYKQWRYQGRAMSLSNTAANRAKYDDYVANFNQKNNPVLKGGVEENVSPIPPVSGGSNTPTITIHNPDPTPGGNSGGGDFDFTPPKDTFILPGSSSPGSSGNNNSSSSGSGDSDDDRRRNYFSGIGGWFNPIFNGGTNTPGNNSNSGNPTTPIPPAVTPPKTPNVPVIPPVGDTNNNYYNTTNNDNRKYYKGGSSASPPPLAQPFQSLDTSGLNTPDLSQPLGFNNYNNGFNNNYTTNPFTNMYQQPMNQTQQQNQVLPYTGSYQQQPNTAMALPYAPSGYQGIKMRF